MLLLQRLNELLAQLGAKVGGLAGEIGGEEHADFDRLRTGIGDLNIDDFAAQSRRVLDEFDRFLPNAINRRAVIDVQRMTVPILAAACRVQL